MEIKTQVLIKENELLKEERRKLREYNCRLNQALSEVGRAELFPRDLNAHCQEKPLQYSNLTQASKREILNTETYVALQTSPGKPSLTEFEILDSQECQMKDTYFMTYDERVSPASRKLNQHYPRKVGPFVLSPNQKMSLHGKENAILTDSVGYDYSRKNHTRYPSVATENETVLLEDLEETQEERLDSEYDTKVTKLTSNKDSCYRSTLDTSSLCSPKAGGYKANANLIHAKGALKHIIHEQSGYYSCKKSKTRPSSSTYTNISGTLPRQSFYKTQTFKSINGRRILEDSKLNLSVSKNSPKYIC